jgi:hypothetical protein
MRRRLRHRFGITAPHVAVRTKVSWYWRVIALALVLACALALAGLIYDTGRRFAGFDRSESDSEIQTLRDKVELLAVESARLRSIANSGESNLQIERTAVDQLTRQVKALEEENARVKENLAVFENLASGGTKAETVTLSRFRVEPDGVIGRYRFRVLASRQGAQANQEFRANLQVYVTVLQAGGDSAMIIFPRGDEPDGARFTAVFRSFRSLEGYFQVPAESKIKRVEIRLVQDGAVKASQSITL